MRRRTHPKCIQGSLICPSKLIEFVLFIAIRLSRNGILLSMPILKVNSRTIDLGRLKNRKLAYERACQMCLPFSHHCSVVLHDMSCILKILEPTSSHSAFPSRCSLPAFGCDVGLTDGVMLPPDTDGGTHTETMTARSELGGACRNDVHTEGVGQRQT